MAENTHRRLAAILASDVVGYSRLMGEDEATEHWLRNNEAEPVTGGACDLVPSS